MSIRLILIRHGESAGNAGLRTADHRTIPLTERGREQAEALALTWEVMPDVIYLSPFRRAQDTAQPTIQRFPSAQLRTSDDLQEFTYLSPATCVNTTKDERRPRVDAYWARLDPTYVDGADAESFARLAERTHLFPARRPRTQPHRSHHVAWGRGRGIEEPLRQDEPRRPLRTHKVPGIIINRQQYTHHEKDIHRGRHGTGHPARHG